jgi:hypothetical protein
MDKDNAAPAEQDPNKSGSTGTGSTIPKSTDGISITSTPGGSSFEPEEDAPVPDSEQGTGEPDKES